eukprot:CAMPEP_0194559330 /NCGR_PEP_ID=MMETSP0292-20121207/912_1 /TAXON_ID=39354 /ORGANISM="Heterosigma akashiwo, Strain CCMP2393" /LENGTH=83 /DNA_ID=CAMNT_0039407205 /DNA_START=238 /DNA_END=490 /DNA_ORIENTATION=+
MFSLYAGGAAPTAAVAAAAAPRHAVHLPRPATAREAQDVRDRLVGHVHQQPLREGPNPLVVRREQHRDLEVLAGRHLPLRGLQ